MLLPRLLLLSISYITALLIFQKGFLLKRQVLPNRSLCSDVISNPNCWTKPLYNRTIWLVIDALRHDFIAPVESAHIPYGERHFRGHMPSVSSLLKSEPQNARLYRFIADAPTTTLQRLKALTTGTLPTFIEAGDNFGGAEILEDNLIDQIKALGRNITFLGDDTWISLYPGRFSREHAVPSFDIKDLHTLDNAVISRIYDEVARDDWNLLIAHCLGVDHCGHRYGPDHPEMANKLRQMDELISKLITQMEDDTLLVVMGDHGMTKDGDHGGDSMLETDAALFVYSKHVLPNVEVDEAVAQINFVPTLALLMDIPIPFSNLGSLITSLIPAEKLSHYLKINCMQITRFAQTYMKHESSVTPQLDWVLRNFEAENSDNPEQLRTSMFQVQQVLRDIWTSFDIAIARLGLIALLEVICFNLVQLISQTTQIKGGFYGNLSVAIWIFRSGLFLLQLSLFLGGNDNDLIITMLHFSLILSIGYHAVVLAIQILSLHFQWKAIMPFILAIVHSLSFLSNSFVVYEPPVIRFLLQTVMIASLIIFLRNNRTSRKWSLHSLWSQQNNRFVLMSFIAATMATRSGAWFERCREEQVDCTQTFMVSTLSSLSLDSNKIFRIFVGICSLIFLNYWLLQKTLIYATRSPSVRVISALSWPTLICISLHWLCEFFSSTLDHMSLRTAQIVYVYFFSTLIFALAFLRRNECFQLIFHSGTLVVAMILGDGLIPNLFALIFINEFSAFIFDNVLWRSLVSSLLISHGFLSLAHTSTLAQIPWQAAFVGIPGNFAIQAIPGALVFLHLFAAAVLLPLHDFTLDRTASSHIISLIVFSGLKACGVSFAAFIHRRHLMVFKIFAPKFIFEGISFIVLCGVLFLFSLLKSLKCT